MTGEWGAAGARSCAVITENYEHGRTTLYGPDSGVPIHKSATGNCGSIRLSHRSRSPRATAVGALAGRLWKIAPTRTGHAQPSRIDSAAVPQLKAPRSLRSWPFGQLRPRSRAALDTPRFATRRRPGDRWLPQVRALPRRCRSHTPQLRAIGEPLAGWEAGNPG